MSNVLTGVNAIICGHANVSIFAQIISALDFETFHKIAGEYGDHITRETYETFIADNGKALINAGLLGKETFAPTNSYSVKL